MKNEEAADGLRVERKEEGSTYIPNRVSVSKIFFAQTAAFSPQKVIK